MLPWLTDFLQDCSATLIGAVQALVWPALFFAGLTVVVKGRSALTLKPAAMHETSINLTLCMADAALMMPPLSVLLGLLDQVFVVWGWRLLTPADWEQLPFAVRLFAALFAGDFIGYWRHRLEHTRWLWPSHALHHSDTEMTWLAIFRFHPVNRITTTVIDSSFLLCLGFPPVSIIVNALVRHYYGQFIHADLPWTLGPFQYVLVSPAMHRWHHARDTAAFGTNFATLFSVFDRVFGTFRVPGPCHSPLGVDELMGESVIGQLAYPFRLSAYADQEPGQDSAPGPLARASAHGTG